MKRKNIFNGMGFAGQLGKLGNVIDYILCELENLAGLCTVTCSFEMITYSQGENRPSSIEPCDVIDADDLPQPITVKYGECVTKPTDPTIDTTNAAGYYFAGWVDENGKLFEFDKPLKRNVVLRPTIGVGTKTPEMITPDGDGTFTW